MSDESPVAAGERLTRTPAGVRLCRLDDIAPGAARNFVLQIGEARFHGFVVRLADDDSEKAPPVRGYVDRCPHMGVPLAMELDRYLTRDGRHIFCSWHGALFDPGDGACLAGPCAGARLTPWPVSLDEHGAVVTA